MNELRIIEVVKSEASSDRDLVRANQLDAMRNNSDCVDYVLENIITSSSTELNEFEWEDLNDAFQYLISARMEIDVDNVLQEIEEHNYFIMVSATEQLRKNIGDEAWVDGIVSEYGIDIKGLSYIDHDDLLNEVGTLFIAELYETLFTGIYNDYFPKIVKFCREHDIELNVKDEDEIYDVLFYANIVDRKFFLSKVSTVGIDRAVLFSAMSGVSGDRAFIMDGILHIPKKIIRRQIT